MAPTSDTRSLLKERNDLVEVEAGNGKIDKLFEPSISLFAGVIFSKIRDWLTHCGLWVELFQSFSE